MSEQRPAIPDPDPIDIEAFARNLGRTVEEGGKALAAYMRPREAGLIRNEFADQIADAVKTLGQVVTYWLADPARMLELQRTLGQAYLELWGNAARRMAGEPVEPATGPEAKDRRFADPEWSSNQFFDFLKQVYLLSSRFA